MFLLRSVLLISLIAVISGCSGNPNGSFNGRVVLVIGDVRINGSPALADSEIPIKSEIKTGPGSVCEIVFNKKNIMHVLENSLMTIDMGTSDKRVKIKSGGIESVLKNLDNSSSNMSAPFKVETESAVAAVRGTSFYIRVLNSTNTVLCACNGVVDLSNPGSNDTKTVESKHHTGFLFTTGTNVATIRQVILKYKNQDELKKLVGHNDKDMEDLAAKIGVKIDWKSVDKGSFIK